MAYKVLIPQDVAQPGKDYLRQRGYEIKMGSGITAEAIAADVVDCDAILARTALFPAKVLEAGKKLKIISRHGVGYDNIDVAKATELGIWVTFAPESNADTVAEHTIGCILAWCVISSSWTGRPEPAISPSATSCLAQTWPGKCLASWGWARSVFG